MDYGWLAPAHPGRDGVSNPRRLHCLFNCWFSRRSTKTSKLRVTGLCAENSPVTEEFPAQKASNAEYFSIWWRHHDGFWRRIFLVKWILDTLVKNALVKDILVNEWRNSMCLAYWSPLTHTCVNELGHHWVKIPLSVWHQTITGTYANILSNVPMGTNLNEMWSKGKTFFRNIAFWYILYSMPVDSFEPRCVR